MKKALILHGRRGTPDTAWFPEIKLDLTKKGYEVFLPSLPDTTHPVFEDQMNKVENIAAYFGKGDIIIAVGLGATLAMQLIEDFGLSNMIIIFVGPTYPGIADDIGKDKLGGAYPYLKPYFNLECEIEDQNNNFHIFLSDNDPLIDTDKASDYYSELLKSTNNTLEIQLLHQKYHFGGLTKFQMTQFPELLELC